MLIKMLQAAVVLFGVLLAHTSTAVVPKAAESEAMEPVNLATIKFSDGRVIHFLEYPLMDELLVEEVTEAGPDVVLLLQQMKGSLLDKYLQLTPEYTPVPEALLDDEVDNMEDWLTESEEQLSDGVIDWIHAEASEPVSRYHAIDVLSEKMATRMIVPMLTDDVFVQADEFELNQSFAVKGAGTGSCNNSSGYLHFENLHCYVSGSKGKGTSKSYCDRGMHGWIQRTSPIKMRTTFSIVANCGTGDAAIIHSKKSWGSYNTVGQRFLGDNQVGSYESAAGKHSIRKYRRVNVLKVTEGGYVRGWTRFHKSVK